MLSMGTVYRLGITGNSAFCVSVFAAFWHIHEQMHQVDAINVLYFSYISKIPISPEVPGSYSISTGNYWYTIFVSLDYHAHTTTVVALPERPTTPVLSTENSQDKMPLC